MQFDLLPPDLFKPLSGKYRSAYGMLLTRLHEGLFSIEVVDQPTRQEVVRDLEETLAGHVQSLPPEAAAEFKLTGADAYTEMIATGWLVEQREGWMTFVEVDAPVARLLETLCTLGQGGDTFGGTMVSVLNNLESAEEHPSSTAQGVSEAAKRAREFTRHMRNVAGTLKTIEKSMLEQASMNGLVRTFFDQFVDRIVIGDYRQLTVARNHPYGFKYRIIDLADRMASEPDLFDRLRDTLVEQGAAPDERSASAALTKDFRDIRACLEAIETFRWRIDRTKARIELRFNNTLRYMDLLETGRADRYSSALATFGQAVKPRHDDSEITIQTLLYEPVAYFDSALLAVPSAPRQAVEAQRFHRPRPDPLRVAFDKAKSEFDRRLTITPERFMDYVKSKMRSRKLLRASDIPPDDIEEFVIFSALRALPGNRIALPDGVSLERREGTVENHWVECGDFVLIRQPATRETRRNAG